MIKRIWKHGRGPHRHAHQTNPEKTTSFSYDANDNIKTITFAGKLITYTYT
ncbi:MAG: hypothetical protein WAV55_00455 [Clostridiaceae bacterium]